MQCNQTSAQPTVICSTFTPTPGISRLKQNELWLKGGKRICLPSRNGRQRANELPHFPAPIQATPEWAGGCGWASSQLI